MSKLTNIVIATDLAAASRHATDRATGLARTHDAILTLVHVLSSSALDELRRWAGDETSAKAVEDDARKRGCNQSRMPLHRIPPAVCPFRRYSASTSCPAFCAFAVATIPT